MPALAAGQLQRRWYNDRVISTDQLFDLRGLPDFARQILEHSEPWQALTAMDRFLADLEPEIHGTVHPTAVLEGPVHVEAGATIGPAAFIQGPAWIGREVSIGHAVYLRGGVIMLEHSSIGHSSEAKRSLFLPGARAPHFNYVGDSIIGSRANLGAGVKVANFHAFGKAIASGGQDTGMRKVGAFIGDDVFIGCNAVLAPGTQIGPRSIIYNGAMIRGEVPADTVVKLRSAQEFVSRNQAGSSKP